MYKAQTGRIEDGTRYCQIEDSHSGQVGPWFQTGETVNMETATVVSNNFFYLFARVCEPACI